MGPLIADQHADRLEPARYPTFAEHPYCAGSDLLEFFDSWEAERPYADPGQQRFRRSVPFGWVRDNAGLVLRIEDGEVAADEVE